MTDVVLYEHLKEFMTEGRNLLFERILNARTRHITVVLEDIYQPHNASAVLRSCECLGIQDVHITESQIKYEVTKGVAMGSSKWLSLHRHGDGPNALAICYKHLRNQGYSIVATTPHEKDCSLPELPIDQPIALVFGTELRGLSDYAMAHADQFVKIPMTGFTESFNISVAAALCLYNLTSRLKNSDIPWNLSRTEKNELLVNWAKKSIKSSDQIIARYLAEHEPN